MKKKISCVLAVAMSMSLCFGCGSEADKPKDNTTTESTTNVVENDKTESAVTTTTDGTTIENQTTSEVEEITTSKVEEGTTTKKEQEATTKKEQETTTKKQQETTTKKQEETTIKQETIEETTTQSQPIKSDRYDEGEYVVGKDIPEGEYVIFAKSLYNFVQFIDNTYKEEIRNEASEHYAYLKLYNNQCLIIKEGYLVPLEKTNFSANDDSSQMKILKVGYNIEPGEYVIEYDATTTGITLCSISYLNDKGTKVNKATYWFNGQGGEYYISSYDDGEYKQVDYDEPISEIILNEGEYIKYPYTIVLRKK